MKIKKEAFERTIINSEYIGYYTHLLSADSCPYHQGKQLDTMRYLLENDRSRWFSNRTRKITTNRFIKHKQFDHSWVYTPSTVCRRSNKKKKHGESVAP